MLSRAPLLNLTFNTKKIMSSQTIKQIAISGAGIGGLAVAAFIGQHCDIPIDIYETKPEVSTIGAPIAIWKRTWQVLQDLGLDKELEKRNIPPPKEGEIRGPIYRKSDSPKDGFDFHNHMMPYGPTALARPVLLELLQALLPKTCTIHTSKHLVEYSIEPSGSVKLYFSDNTTAIADVLIGADGVHSTTRASMYKLIAAATTDPSLSKHYEQFIEPIWSGTFAYRCSVKLDEFRSLYPDHQALTIPKIWCGKNKHVVTHPYPPGNIINVNCFYTVDAGEGAPYDGPWVTDVTGKEVIDRYEGWEPSLTQLIQHISTPSRWAIHVVPPLPQVIYGRVAILGDAAHAMKPHQGTGGGQAIEDAHILGHLLSHKDTDLQNVEDVLRAYQEVRMPIAQNAAATSRSNGFLYEFNHPEHVFPVDASPEVLKPLGDLIGRSFTWLAHGDCKEDWGKAESLLDKYRSEGA